MNNDVNIGISVDEQFINNNVRMAAINIINNIYSKI